MLHYSVSSDAASRHITVTTCRVQVLSCANELALSELVRECMTYMVARCSADTAVLHYSIAERQRLPQLRDSLLQFIYDRFSEVAGNEQFLHVPADRLRAILASDRLCARNELEIFDVRLLPTCPSSVRQNACSVVELRSVNCCTTYIHTPV